MQCPKCKKNIPDNVLRCPNCNLLVKMVCKKCGAVNPMGKIVCEKCGENLLKICPNCKTINKLDAKKCRKCSTSFEIKKETITEKPIEQTKNIVEPPQENILQKEETLTSNNVISSTDNINLSDEQFENVINLVDEINKSTEKQQEAENIVQKKFEQQNDIDEQLTEEIPPEYMQLDQEGAKKEIVEAIQNPLKKIISLNGKEGSGKSLILQYVFDALKSENYVWALGECNALTQITPFGYIQDVLLFLFNIKNYSVNINDFIKNNKKALQAQFFNLNNDEIMDLINFLYPYETAEFNGILKRKEYTINLLKKVFENLILKSSVIFVIDDFENIDGASFSFLKKVLEDDKLNEKVKLLITNKHNKIAQGYFYNKSLKSNNYANIFLSVIEPQKIRSLINDLFGCEIEFPQKIFDQIVENSKGSSAYIEQACHLMFELGMFISTDNNLIFNSQFIDFEFPINTYKIIEERLKLLENQQPIMIKALYYAALLGSKFSISQFENVLQLEKNDFNVICNNLINTNYLRLISENYLTFKNTLIWHYVYERAKTDENFIEFNKSIYSFVKNLTLSNNSLKPLLLQNFEDKKEAFENWKKNAETSSYLGDTNLYVISLKQQLKLANDIPDLLTPEEKVKIYKRMGKVLYKISPKEAINYISTVIAYYKEEQNYNPIEIIEMSSYLVKSCQKVADYLGVIETCDTVVSALPSDKYEIEKALITSKKLSSLIYLGNCEEVINLANTEILNVIEEALAQPNSSAIVSDRVIFDIWVETSMNLAKAYSIQGDKKAYNILSKIDDALVVNKMDNDIYKMKILLIKALAHTLRGEAKLSSEILTSITSQYSPDNMKEEFILRWNFVNIINKILTKDYQNIVDEMFQVTTFADNLEDLFIKNILKLLLGYIIHTKSKNREKAMEIFNEEIVFFAKEKIAVGALLSWSFISMASLSTKGVDFALDIAQKALDVAKSPKINNYTFIVALKYMIADYYMMKGDFDATKMYIEKGMVLAQKYDLKYWQMLLYISLAHYNQELMNVYTDDVQIYANRTLEMYLTAQKIAQQLSFTIYENNIKKDLTSFNVACQLKNIQMAISE